MIEEWKTIENYPDYMISNIGNVKSLKFGKEKILKNELTKFGYYQITLVKNGITKRFKIHRLVAMVFIPNPQNLPIINHINEDKTDNRVENLEWCDYKYNSNYGNCRNKIGNSNSLTHKKPILQFTLNGDFIKKWDGAIDIEKETNISRVSISACCKCKKHNKTAGGYKWGYADEYEKIPFKVFDLEIYRKKVA